MIHPIWRFLQTRPLWLKVVLWIAFFWLLVPLAIWRSSMSRRPKIVFTVAFVVVLLLVVPDGYSALFSFRDRLKAAPGGLVGSSELAPEALDGGLAHVSRVIDGDTVEVQLQGRTVDVRLIGIDTPETVHPSEPVGCYGPEASDFTKRSLEGERVRLEFDVEKTDRYGRTLAYVWQDGSMFNEVLVERGLAQVSTYPPNVKYVERFTAAQQRARDAASGFWGSCPAGDAAAPTDSNALNGVDPSAGGKCDPNYEGTCIPPYPPDLDCGDVSASGFQSVGSDAHGFDGDGDGIGCE